MSALFFRNVLPVATAIVSTLFLATAVPHDLQPATVVASTSLARAEVQQCLADGRDADACLDEADGKALIERAEALSSDDASRRASR